MNKLTESHVRVVASARTWIQHEAIRQFYAAARLGGVRRAVGFPDLHPGRGAPVGAAYVTEGLIYPHMVGGDIGCGMTLLTTDLPVRGADLERWSDLRFDLEHPWEGDVRACLAGAGVAPTPFDDALGTIGGGNHFAELQAVEEIHDAAEFRRARLRRDHVLALVHSGSRGVGEAVLRAYAMTAGAGGLPAPHPAAADYLAGHDLAVAWARVNRALIARRLLTALGAGGRRVWDGCHNSITPWPAVPGQLSSHRPGRSPGASLWVHRKGAVPTGRQAVVIPGSRGSFSYLVKRLGDGDANAWSLAHGAGRKWARSESRWRMRERFGVAELAQTPLGGRVVCEQRDLLYEEAPAAYKNIDVVVQDLVEAGLASVVATLRPLLTYKTRAWSRA